LLASARRKSVSAAQSRPDTGGLREAARETGAETEGAVSSGFSEVVSDTPPMVHGGGESGTGTAGIEGRGPGGSDATRGGSGATKMAGAAGTETGPGEGLAGAGEIAKKTYVKEHFAFIRDLILKNLVYPAIARRMGWRGDLTVSFVICESGTVDDIRILKSSGHKVLDETAVATIRGIAPFPRPPVRAEIIIPIEYRIG
jgi:protein TonB